PLKLVRTFSEPMRGSHPDCEAVPEKVFDRANKISCWRLKDLTNSCLPTQLSPPQAWEERPLSPLTLQSSEPARPSAPRKNPWLRAAQRQNFLRQVLVMIGMTILCIFGYYLFSRFVATSVIVQGRCMMLTLQDGDRFILNLWSY